MSISQSQKDELEIMIDRSSLHEVLNALADICAQKADHIQSNYQDKPLAKTWMKVSWKLTKLENDVFPL